MTIAIHQPNYLPWLGYFYKIYASDVFVFHDVVEFSKASYTKRCKIRKHKSAPETCWLSVPILQHKEGTLIKDILISDTRNWATKHLHQIENTYAAAPYYHVYNDWVGQILNRAQAMGSLAAMNIFLIRTIAQKLALKSQYFRSSELTVAGKGSALNLAIARQLHATAYLAGSGSRNYQDDDTFHASGIRTIQHDLGAWLNAHPYEQGTGQFTVGVSVMDALMHIGAEGIREIFGIYQSEQTS